MSSLALFLSALILLQVGCANGCSKNSDSSPTVAPDESVAAPVVTEQGTPLAIRRLSQDAADQLGHRNMGPIDEETRRHFRRHSSRDAAAAPIE